MNLCTTDLNCTTASDTCVKGAGVKCFKLACNNSEIITTDCAADQGICLAAARLDAASAAFDASRRSIDVTLASAAKPGRFACSAIFDANTTATLGASALCRVTPEAPAVLSVVLSPASTVKAADTLVTGDNLDLVEDLSGAPFNFTVSVADCTDCLKPVAIMLAPSVSIYGVCLCVFPAFSSLLHSSQTPTPPPLKPNRPPPAPRHTQPPRPSASPARTPTWTCPWT
jgi:hypothetical protein